MYPAHRRYKRAEIRLFPELCALVEEIAQRDNLPRADVIVRLVAKQLRRPDLAEIPRRTPGRPRKQPLKGDDDE